MYELDNLKSLSLPVSDDCMPVKLLSDVIDFRLEQSFRVSSKIYNEVLKQCEGSKLSLDDKEESRLVVDIDDETMQGIRDGNIKLVKEKGFFYAQLRENGKYSRKLPIKEEVFKDDLGDFKLDYALQIQALHESLNSINDKLIVIDKQVRDVINGQQNDRIALFYSGASLFAESLCISDENMKKLLVAQSIKSLTESIFKLTLIMNEDIQYLKDKEYKKIKRKSADLVDEKMNSIKQCYSIIHKSFILKSAIYGFQGEMKALSGVLNEYSNFIREYIIKNNTMLVQLDCLDTGKDTGIWKSKILLESNISNLVKTLNTKENIYYLEKKVED